MAEGVSRLAEIKITLAETEPDFEGRYCGTQSIDDMLKDSYYSGLLDKCRLLEAKADGITVGYCAYYFRDIRLSDEEYSSGFRDNQVACMYIRYIAVKKDFQGHKIGNTILAILCEMAKQQRQYVPFRMIVIDAFKHLQAWYERHGFKQFYEEGTENLGHVHMKMDLQDQAVIDRYCDRE